MKKETELKGLTEEQKATVLAWLDAEEPLRSIVEKLAKAEPEGFGVVTNIATLSRMAALWREERLLSGRPEQAERARALMVREEESVEFQRATISVLQRRLFESAIDCHRQREQRETLRMMLDFQLRVRRLDLAERRLAHSKRVFEFNAARTALKHWNEFKGINAVKGADDEEKIWMARDVVFVGPEGEKSLVQKKHPQPDGREVMNKPEQKEAADANNAGATNEGK